MFIVGGTKVECCGFVKKNVTGHFYDSCSRLPCPGGFFALLLSGLIFTGHFVGGGNLRILVSN